WAAWEHGLDATPARAEDARHWREALAGAPTTLDLPTDRPYGAQQDYAGAWLPVRVEAGTTARMRESARAHGGTLYAWLMTASAAWLARLTQSEDFLVGAPVAGRHRAEAESLLGCFINTLPIRIDASGDPTFAELFARVRDALAGAFTHQRHPFDAMVEELGVARDASRPPLVQTVLSFQSGGEPGDGARLRLGDLPMRPAGQDGSDPWVDVSAVLWEADGGLGGILAYRTALFDEATVKGSRQDRLALAEAGLGRPPASIHDLLDDAAWSRHRRRRTGTSVTWGALWDRAWPRSAATPRSSSTSSNGSTRARRRRSPWSRPAAAPTPRSWPSSAPASSTSPPRATRASATTPAASTWTRRRSWPWSAPSGSSAPDTSTSSRTARASPTTP